MDDRTLTLDAETLKKFISFRLSQFIKEIINMSKLPDRNFSEEKKEQLISKILNSDDMQSHIKKACEKQSPQTSKQNSQVITKLILEEDLFSRAKQMADTTDLITDLGIDFITFSDKVDKYSEFYSINVLLLYETVRQIDKHTNPEKRKMMKKYLMVREKLKNFELKKADAVKKIHV